MPEHSPNFLTRPHDKAPKPPEKPGKKEDPVFSHAQAPAKAPEVHPRAYGKHAQHTPVRTGRRTFRTIGCWGFFALLIVFVAATAMPLYSLAKAYRSAQTAKAAINDVRAYAAASEFDAAASSVSKAQLALRDASANLSKVGFWRDMPGTGTQLRALEDAASAADQGLDAAKGLLTAAQAVSEAFQANAYAEIDPSIAPKRSYADLSLDEKRDVLRRLNAAVPAMRIARDKASLALELWQRVPQDQLLQPLSQAMQPLAEGLPAMKQALDESIPLIETMLPLAGYPQKMRTLVLLQNSDEIRPTGGFIGSLGLIEMDGGDLARLDFSDVYSIDNLVSSRWKDVPPAPIKDRLGVNAWFLRDANWSPDYPSSAARILDVFQRETALAGAPQAQPGAVIAFTPAFFEGILRLTGPVTVDGKTYSADDFFDKIQFEVEQGFLKQGTKLEDRKAVLGKLGEAVAEKLKQLPPTHWGDVLDLITQAFERKQIQAFATDPGLLAKLDARGWTGRTKATDGDFVWGIDANLAALKTDGVMQKHITYALDAHDTTMPPIATVAFEYTNTNKTIDWRYTRYRSYTRLYVPEGSELIEAKGAMLDDRYRTGGKVVEGRVDVYKDLGKTVFGAFWSIEPGTTGKLTFRYRVPQDLADSIRRGTYRLDWPKQAGADETKLTLDLRFAKNIRTAEPPEPPEKWGDVAYQVTTDSLIDRQFELKLAP